MKPFPFERQPKDSSLSVFSPDAGAIILELAAPSRIPSIILLGLTGAIVVWLICLACFRPAMLDQHHSIKMIGLAGLTLAFGIACLFGHYRIKVSRHSVAKSMRVFGIDIFKDRVQFKDIRGIECKTDKKRFVVLLHRSSESPVFIEDFASAAERDWIAEWLHSIWLDELENKDSNNG